MFHSDFGHSRSNHVGISRDSKILGSAVVPTLGWGVADSLKHTLPICVSTLNLVVLCQSIRELN